MLKAVIIRKTGDRPPFIHKLPALADMAGVDLPAELDRALLLIDAHYMKARYFSDRFNKEIYNRKNATELVALTKELMRWLREGAGFKN